MCVHIRCSNILVRPFYLFLIFCLIIFTFIKIKHRNITFTFITFTTFTQVLRLHWITLIIVIRYLIRYSWVFGYKLAIPGFNDLLVNSKARYYVPFIKEWPIYRESLLRCYRDGGPSGKFSHYHTRHLTKAWTITLVCASKSPVPVGYYCFL